MIYTATYACTMSDSPKHPFDSGKPKRLVRWLTAIHELKRFLADASNNEELKRNSSSLLTARLFISLAATTRQSR